MFRSKIRFAAAAAALSVCVAALPAGASITGKYNKAAADMVPSAYKGVTLHVATDASYAPDEFLSGTQMKGFDIDLIKAIAKTLGVKISMSNVTFDNIIPGLQAKRYDIGNSSFTDNLSREKQVNFVTYFQAGEGFYAKKGANINVTSLKLLCGHTVAVETGTVEETDAKSVECAGTKKVTVLSFAKQTDADTAVLSGQAEVGFLDSQIAGYIVEQSKGKFENIGRVLNVAPYGIAFQKNKNGHELAMATQMAIKALIRNGTYHAILSKWGVTSGALTAKQVVLNGAHS